MTSSSNSYSADWSSVRLGDFAEKIGSGFTPLGGHNAYRQSGIPLIRSQNVHMNRFEPDGLAFISPEQDAEMSSTRVSPDDVLLNITGASIGRVCVAPAQYCPANVNQHVCIIRSNGSFNPHFLAYYFASPGFQRFVTDSQAGATRQALTKGGIENLRVPFIEREHQDRIAAHLREQLAEVERARAAVAAQLEAAETLPAALLRAVFSSPAAQLWPRRNLADVCNIVAKQVDPRLPEFRDMPHVSGENIVSGICKLEDVRSAAEDRMTSGKYLFEQGDVLYSKLRPYLRKAALAPYRGLCSADMYPIRVNEAVLDARFATWMLVSEPFTKYAISESDRSRMPKLNREQLFGWEAPLPPLAEQQRLAARLAAEFRAAQSLRESLEQKLAAVEKLPAALLREAFNPVPSEETA